MARDVIGQRDTLIFTATYNERTTIEPLLDGLLALPVDCDVLVVDDRGTDGTTGLLERRSSEEPRIEVIFRPEKRGIGSAHRLGWQYARRSGYSRIVTLDADLSHDVADVPRLLAALDHGADVAIGSRFAPGGRLDYKGFRRVLSRSANRLAKLLLRLPFAEYTTSLRAARLDRIPPGLVETIENEGYGFFLSCVVRFAREGLAITEVPIRFHVRGAGRSKISGIEILRSALNLISLAFGKKQAPCSRGVSEIGEDVNSGATSGI